MKKFLSAVLKNFFGPKTVLSFMIAIASLIVLQTSIFADFSNSPTNYVSAISDLYVCNVDAGSISVLNGETGGTIKTIALPAGAKPFGIVFRPDYVTAYVTDNGFGKVYRISGKANKVVTTITTPATSTGAIAMNPSGKFAYISSSAGILILDTDPSSAAFNTITGTVSGDGVGGDSIVFTPDGTRAYLSKDGSYGSLSQVSVVDTETHTLIRNIQLPVPTAPLGLSVSPDGNRVYVTGWVANNVSVIDSNPLSPTYNNVIAAIPVSGEARGIALSPTGNLAYVTLDTGGVDVIVTAPSSNQFNQVIKHITNAGPFGGIHGVATSLDGRFTYVTVGDTGQNKIYVIDSEPFSATFNTMKGTFTVGNVPLGIAVKPHSN